MEILLFQTKIENSRFRKMDYQRHQYLVYPVPVSGHLVVVANLSFLDLLILKKGRKCFKPLQYEQQEMKLQMKNSHELRGTQFTFNFLRFKL